jgi:hypothetical protein
VRNIDDLVSFWQTGRRLLGDWLEPTRRQESEITRSEVIAALDEQRGPWSEAGR